MFTKHSLYSEELLENEIQNLRESSSNSGEDGNPRVMGWVNFTEKEVQ